MKALLENPMAILFGGFMLVAIAGVIGGSIVEARSAAAKLEFMRACVAKSEPVACAEAWKAAR